MEQIIKSIRKHIRENRLSFLIGSGFSKNASPIYPDWNELMTDMLNYLYENKIQLSYKQCDQSIDYNKYRTDYLNQIVAELGYLKIASEYIKRKQYREAIDIYIEDHIPFATKRGEKYYASKKELNLTLHKRLLSLNAQNIYTFNYDNLLELASGADTAKENRTQKDKYSNDIDSLHEYIEAYESKHRELSATINFKDTEIMDHTEEIIRPNIPYLIEQMNSLIDSFNQSKNLSLEVYTEQNYNEVYLRNLKTLNEEKDKYSYKRKSLEDTLDQCYYPVTKSWEISLTERAKNIYKLHGDLREYPQKSQFGFDGDSHIHYVITQEDYGTYHLKHEAFVNLMRISLLKGVFCAIGFGGDDHNFLTWIAWVRDILEKGREDGGSTETKIYFIDVGTEELSPEKSLMFKNHNIEHVRLSNIYGIKTRYELLDAFLSDIAFGSFVQEYKDAWGNIPWKHFYHSSDKKDVAISAYDSNRLFELARKCSLPSLGTSATHQIDIALLNLHEIILTDKFGHNEAKVVYAAIKGQRLPIDCELSSEEIERIVRVCRNNRLLNDGLKLLLTRRDVLYNHTIKAQNNADEGIYEYCLQHAFRLDFSKLKSQLSNWKPQSKLWEVRKIVFQAVLGLDGKSELIKRMKTTIESEEFTSNQEYIYALESIERIEGFFYDDITEKKINKMKSQDVGCKRLYDVFDYFQRKLTEHDEKILPYEESTRVTYVDGHNPLIEPSVQLVQTFIELGLPLQVGRRGLFSNKRWYPAFKNIFDRYPYPCLYYSLQLGTDEKFLTRIAQDYVYSGIELRHIEQMLEYMLAALLSKETPFIIKEGIYVVARLFMKRVESEKWCTLFKKFYSELELEQYDDQDVRNRELRKFIVAGVEMCGDVKSKQSVISFCLGLPKLAHFHNSLIIAAKSNLDNIYKKDTGHLTAIIKRVDSMAEFYVLFNLKSYFTENQKRDFIAKLAEYDKYGTGDCQSTMIEAASRFADESDDISCKIRAGIINHKRLWNTGISKSGEGWGYGSPDNVELLKMKKIYFSDNEIISMYNQLKDALVIVKDTPSSRVDLMFGSQRRLLLMMTEFLHTNQVILSKENDFQEVLNSAVMLHKSQCENKTLVEMLVSTDSDIVGMGLQTLIFYFRMYGVEKYSYEYSIIANAIISGHNEALESYFDYFTYFIDTYPDLYKDNSQLKISLGLILNVYEKYFAEEPAKWDLSLRKEFAEECLSKLYAIYSKCGGSSEFWSSYTRIFNSVD